MAARRPGGTNVVRRSSFAAISLVWCVSHAPALPAEDPELSERLLLTVPEGEYVGKIYVSPGGRTAVAIVPARDEHGQKRLIAPTHQSAPFRRLTTGGVIFSPDGKRVAYMTTGRKGPGDGQRTEIVFDGRKAREYSAVSSLASFDPTGKRFAYLVGTRRSRFGEVTQWSVFVDGEEVGTPSVKTVHRLSWSPDGEKLAFVVFPSRGTCRLEVDGRLITDSPSFTPIYDSSGALVWVARSGNHFAVYVDRKRGALYDEVTQPTFGADGKTVAYAARRGKKWYTVIGEKRQSKSFASRLTGLQLAADGKTLAFSAPSTRGKRYVQIGRKKGPTFDGIRGLQFVPGTKTVAYIGTYRAKAKGRRDIDHVVFRGRKGPACSLAVRAELTFSPDGKRVAYFSSLGGGKRYVIDGDRRHGPYTVAESLTFSPDSSGLAYLVTRGGTPSYNRNLVVGDRTIEKVRGPIQFSADGKKIAYVQVVGREIWWKVTALD